MKLRDATRVPGQDRPSAVAQLSKLPFARHGERHYSGSCFFAGANEYAVKLLVTPRRCVPRKIARHGTRHQRYPSIAISENFPRALNRIPKSAGGIFVAKKAIPAIGRRIIIFDDFLNAAGREGERMRTVLQAVHCAQTSRLEARGNQRHIHSCLDQMGEWFLIMSPVGKLRRKISGCDSEGSLKRGIALAENDQAHVVRKETVERGHQDLEPFFFDHSRDHSKNRAARGRGESQITQKGVAADFFAPKRTRVIESRQKWISFWIPTRVIRAMQDSGELGRVFAQDSVESATIFRRLHLALVMLAHGRDLVGE